ncbi:MAG: dynamin family protein [Paraprevotella sp.]|nr:dynamin family protein [Paraprevotella sp.]
MDNFLTHTFSIKNHPICELKNIFKVQYVMGLGEFMYHMSKKDGRARLVFEVWARSIVDSLPASYWQCTSDFSRIRKAISLKREGINFFTMRRAFFFDCFYLVSKLDAKLLKIAQAFLYAHVKDFIAKRVLNDVYNNWDKTTLNKIPSQLILHKKTDEDFHNKHLKRILVVATMSAGKSTLINALVGYRINTVKATACTSKLCYLYNKPSTDGIIVKCENGGYLYNYDVESPQKGEFVKAGLHFNSSLSDCRICFIDTPGTNYSGDQSHGEITRKAIASNDYDGLIFVSNALYFNTEDERTLLDYTVSHTKKTIVFVLNQLDGFNPRHDSIKEIYDEFEAILKAKRVRPLIVPLSGYYSLLLRIKHRKFDDVEREDFISLNKRFQKDFYRLPVYCKNSAMVKGNQNRELYKSGIIILENIIKSI